VSDRNDALTRALARFVSQVAADRSKTSAARQALARKAVGLLDGVGANDGSNVDAMLSADPEAFRPIMKRCGPLLGPTPAKGEGR